MRVRSSAAEALALTLVGLLALAGVARADAFSPVLEHARSAGVPGLEQALRDLYLVEPFAAWGGFQRYAIAASRDDASIQEAKPRRREFLESHRVSSRRALDLVRLSHLYQHPVAVRAYGVLRRLDQDQLAALDEIRHKHRATWIQSPPQREYRALTLVRSGLYLEPTLEALFIEYSSKALGCWAQQKVLAGATEMYNLDFNTDVKELDDALIAKFRERKYMSRDPVDPGFGPGSQVHFVLRPGGGYFCVQHASSMLPEGAGPDMTVRELAVLVGIKDPKVLRRCAEIPVVPRSVWGSDATQR